ncbi:MAG TPA: hypothetical protein VGI92_10545 [Gemmatimonadales bacterium]
MTGCGNQSARAPNPTAFEWPRQFAYRIDYVSEAQKDLKPLARFSSTRTLHLTLRDAQYVVESDSIIKTSQLVGHEPTVGDYVPEDTLAFYARIGKHGEISGVSLACDPAVPACGEALPSTIMIEMRSVIPRLSEWEAPKGGTWIDTLPFDDASRSRGVRGTVITTYTGRGDTIIGGRNYWLISWSALRQAYRRDAGASPTLGAETPIQQTGITLVDKRALLPVLSTWAGAITAPPAMKAMGATGAGFRGRAYLTGSPFDSLYNGPVHP